MLWPAVTATHPADESTTSAALDSQPVPLTVTSCGCRVGNPASLSESPHGI